MKAPTGKAKVQVVSQNSKIGMEDVSMILSEKITEERKKNGWSQEELAEKLEFLKSSFSPTGEITEEGYATVESFCLEQELISKEIPYEDIIATSFMDKALGK